MLYNSTFIKNNPNNRVIYLVIPLNGQVFKQKMSLPNMKKKIIHRTTVDDIYRYQKICTEVYSTFFLPFGKINKEFENYLLIKYKFTFYGRYRLILGMLKVKKNYTL